MEHNKKSLYENWLNDIVEYNKSANIGANNAIATLHQNFLATKKSMDNKADEALRFIEKCKEHLAEKLKQVHSHLLKYNRDMPTTYGTVQIEETEADKLRQRIDSTLVDIGATVSKVTSQPPATAISPILLIVLLFLYVVPGIIYLIYKNKSKEEDQAVYEKLARDVQFAYSLLAKYGDVSLRDKAKNDSMLDEKEKIERASLLQQFKTKAYPLIQKLNSGNYSSGFSITPWNDKSWNDWKAPDGKIPQLVFLGKLLQEEKGREASFPAFAPFQQGRGLMYKARSEYREDSVQSAKSVMLRILFTTQPGKVELSLIDPLQLGGSVGEFLSLADIDPDLINQQVCSSQEQISSRLAMLVERIKTIQQVYLKTDFPSIEAYNDAEQTIAEPYRLLFINDFPVGFSDDSIRNLVSIAKNGPKCGIYPIIITIFPYQHYQAKQFSEIEDACMLIDMTESHFFVNDPRFDMYHLQLDASPDFGRFPLFKEMLLSIATQAQKGKKVEYAYTDMLRKTGLDEKSWWTYNTGTLLDVPMGPTGARRFTSLILGKDMAHGVLCVGKPGSGKSNLMTVIITTLALKYPPSELELYLVDLKSGVTFKPFAASMLPHAKTIAIDSDRELSLAVLQGLENEMERRGVIFRNVGAGNSNLEASRRLSGEPLPRILMIVDEFQELFTLDDDINNESRRILTRLIREGRQFGIHIFLGTQSLSGVDISGPILELVAVRIALQCSDAESRVVLSADNAAARLLKRPGEAIYNDKNGLPDSNVQFQVALFKDSDYKLLDHIRKRYEDQDGTLVPNVFDGSVPSRLSDMSAIKDFLRGDNLADSGLCAWIGRPVNMSESLSVRFLRQSGDHLSIVGGRRMEGISVMLSVMLGISLSQRERKPHVVYMSYDDEEANHNRLVRNIGELFGDGNFLTVRRLGLVKIIESLRAAVDSQEQDRSFDTFLFLDAFHKSRDFIFDYDASTQTPGANLRQILKYGPDKGVHVVIRCESLERLTEMLGADLAEIHFRVAGAMDIARSMQYIEDSHAANLSKANRMILYHATDSQQRYTPFIPYEMPSDELIAGLVVQDKKGKKNE